MPGRGWIPPSTKRLLAHAGHVPGMGTGFQLSPQATLSQQEHTEEILPSYSTHEKADRFSPCCQHNTQTSINDTNKMWYYLKEKRKTARLTLLKVQQQPVHRSQIQSAVDHDKDFAFVSVGATAPLQGERMHFTC